MRLLHKASERGFSIVWLHELEKTPAKAGV